MSKPGDEDRPPWWKHQTSFTLRTSLQLIYAVSSFATSLENCGPFNFKFYTGNLPVADYNINMTIVGNDTN